MPRLIIVRASARLAAEVIALPTTVGGGAGDRLRVEALPAGALRVWPALAGLVVEVRAPGASVGARPLAPGTRRLLRPGDALVASGCELACEDDPAPDTTRALAGAILSGRGPGEPGPRLVVLEGPAAGATFPARHGGLIGRGPAADVRLEDPRASRRHARLALRGGRVHVHDLGSKNGLHVGGRRARRVRLRPGLPLGVGGSLLALEPDAREVARAPDRPAARRACAALLALAAALALAALA